MTKIKNYIICIPIIIGFMGSFCLGLKWDYGELEEKFPYQDKNVDNLECDDNTDLGNCISIKEDETKESDDTIIRRLLQIFGLESNKHNDLKFIDYAKAIINMTLSLVAFIALIMSIYTFYLMIFSENEAGIKKAKGNLTGIFIALCIIGFARLIVSVIFWRYDKYRYKDTNNIQKLGAKSITMIQNNPIHNQIYPII